MGADGPFSMTIGPMVRAVFPEGLWEDIRDQGNAIYGEEKLDAFYRQIEVTKVSPGVWQIQVGPPL